MRAKAGERLMPVVGVALAALASASLIVFSLVAQHTGASLNLGKRVDVVEPGGVGAAPMTVPAVPDATSGAASASDDETTSTSVTQLGGVPLVADDNVASIASDDTGFAAPPAQRPGTISDEPGDNGWDPQTPEAGGDPNDSHYPKGKAWGYWGLSPGQVKHDKPGRAEPPDSYPKHPATTRDNDEAFEHEDDQGHGKGHAYGHSKHDEEHGSEASEGKHQDHGHAEGHDKDPRGAEPPGHSKGKSKKKS